MTGLLDGYQEGRQKLSMYTIAKNIGLPATFVELRHQCTHEELPSLYNLRAASKKALTWIEKHYWHDLDAVKVPLDSETCQDVIQEYLHWRASDDGRHEGNEADWVARLKSWNRDQLLEALEEIDESSSMNASITLHALRLRRSIMNGDLDVASVLRKQSSKGSSNSLDAIRAEMAEAKDALEGDESKLQPVSKGQVASQISNSAEAGNIAQTNGWTMWEGPWISKPIGIT